MGLKYIALNLCVGVLLALFAHWYDGSGAVPPERSMRDGVDIGMYAPGAPKPVRAAFVVLVRNSELPGMKQAMRQIEDRFNNKFNYPYVFLNDVPFTDEFVAETTAMTRAN
ncbi:hypothetical protein GGH95_003890, partial [Coemansia sp. RSA 1836]